MCTGISLLTGYFVLTYLYRLKHFVLEYPYTSRDKPLKEKRKEKELLGEGGMSYYNRSYCTGISH
jgi:hypothetical protein